MTTMIMISIQIIREIDVAAANLFEGNKDSPEGGLDGLMQVFLIPG